MRYAPDLLCEGTTGLPHRPVLWGGNSSPRVNTGVSLLMYDEQTYEQTEKASSPAFTQAGKHRAVPFALCDVALLDAVLCG